MDSFNIADLKFEKANAILRYRRIQKITALLRFLELCVVLILIPRFSIQLLVIFRLFGEYFRGLSMTLFSPRFVFVFGNAIIIILFVKSGHYSTSTIQDDTKNSSRIYDLYSEGVEENRNSQREQSECGRKQSMSDDDDWTMSTTCELVFKERKIVRSHSDQFFLEAKPRRELRRSVTERCQKSVNYNKKAAVVEEEMNSDEFRQTVEAFIARQQKSLREEEASFE